MEAVRIPETILKFWKTKKDAEKDITEAAVIDLVRRKKISKSKAAELLGLNLWDIPKLMARHKITWFDYPPEELSKDFKNLKKVAK